MEMDGLIENSFQLFQSESEKLEKIIESLPKDYDKTIPSIINLYYQIIMVQTLSKKLKSIFESSANSESQNLLDKINKTQNYVTENFSKSLHPEILYQLTNSIEKYIENLKSLGQNSEKKTKETIEKEALLYKELRELMSTKEFVEQYEIGLKDD